MEHSWRSGPASAGNLCPVCFNLHFPWCPPHYPTPPPPPHRQFAPPPPPLPPQNPYAPPPPPPLSQNPYAPQPPYNPFIDHQNPYTSPPRPPPPPRNFTTDYYGNTSKPVINQPDSHGVKRMRFDYATSEDDRRLKMIRDHGHLAGAATHSFNDRSYIDAPRGNNIGQKFAQPQSAYNGPPFYAQHLGYEVNGIRGVEAHKNYQGIQKVSTYDKGNPLTETGNQFSQSLAMQQHVMDKLRPVQGFNGQAPLPNFPPPPLTIEPPVHHLSGSVKLDPNSRGYHPEERQATPLPSSKTFTGANAEFQHQNLPSLKQKIVDASHILKHPHRANRPDHIVVILRGLPGSGKSYLAKFLRDVEVENGGSAPRIHSMDDYFMTEVEKVEEIEGLRSSGSVRGKKSITKVMEYCYEPEMEEAYRASMLKAFKKTLDEGAFPFVIVDDRNLRVADFAQFWATAKRSGYEVYLLEATYKDPAGCAARNVHGFTQRDINKMADLWEEAPSLYMKLDIKSLLHGDALEENGIEEVDMDTEDGGDISTSSGAEDVNPVDVARTSNLDLAADGPSEVEQKWAASEEHSVEAVKELGKSKWSNILDEDDAEKVKIVTETSGALAGLTESYSKKGKSVRWADKVGSIGFSIGTGKTTNVSLIIGPGSGYNLKSNPLPEEEKPTQRSGELRSGKIFQEQLRAESESFRAVFDNRRHRIGRLEVDEV